MIDGIRFSSRVLRVNLDPIHRVFPHVATCGKELEEWSEGIADPLDRFAADYIKELAVRDALEYLRAHICAVHAVKKLSHMNPGSLPDWPLPQQAPLFKLLGDLEALIGVQAHRELPDAADQDRLGHLLPDRGDLRELPALPAGGVPQQASAVRSGALRGPLCGQGAHGREEGSWQEQLARSITTVEDLSRIIRLDPREEQGVRAGRRRHPAGGSRPTTRASWIQQTLAARSAGRRSLRSRSSTTPRALPIHSEKRRARLRRTSSACTPTGSPGA